MSSLIARNHEENVEKAPPAWSTSSPIDSDQAPEMTSRTLDERSRIMLRRVLLATTVAVLFLAGVTGTGAQAASANSAPAQATSVRAADTGPCPYNGAHPTLRRYSTGASVSHLQCLLKHVWGYSGLAIDGDFGPATELTVAAHQIDCHITVDGVVGPVTWSRLHPNSTTAQCRDSGRN
jgi:zinc D-Ala-D-Ala carboxypeptidase